LLDVDVVVENCYVGVAMISLVLCYIHGVVNNQPRKNNSSFSTYLDSMEGAKVLELRTPLFFLRRTEFRRPVLSKLSVSR
jgi:hypothetical protein